MYLFFFLAFIIVILLDSYVPKDSFLNIENSTYESLQYIILLSGAGFALRDILKSNDYHVKNLGKASLPAWLVIQGREINWFRVYYQYATIYKKTIAYPIITIMLLYATYMIYKHKIFINIWILLKNKLLPRAEFFTLFLLAFGHYLGEKILHSAFIEMSMEFFCYTNLFLITYRVRTLFNDEKYKHLLK